MDFRDCLRDCPPPGTLLNGVEIAVSNAMRAGATRDLVKWSGNSCPKCNACRRIHLPEPSKWSGNSCSKCNARRCEYRFPGTLQMEWK